MGLSTLNLPILKEEIPHGVCDIIVSDARILKDTKGQPILYLADICVIISFSYAGLITEKAFRLGDHFEHKAYKKLLAILGVDTKLVSFSNTNIIGKKVCIFVQKVTKRETGENFTRIVNYKPTGKDYSFLTSELYI